MSPLDECRLCMRHLSSGIWENRCVDPHRWCPGITNCVDGVASASAEEDSVLVLAGDVAWAGTGKVLAQASGPDGFHAEGTLRAFTRAQIRVHAARNVTGCTLAALQAAQNPQRPGPALLILPIDIGTEPVADAPKAVRPILSPIVQAPLPNQVLRKAANALLLAKRPLIIVGSKCRRCPKELDAFLAATHRPFVVTVHAKGVVKEDQDWSLHNCGLGNKPFIVRYSSSPIDVVIAIGTAMDDSAMSSVDVSTAALIYHVYPDATVFGRNHATTQGILSDAGAFCAEMTQALEREEQLLSASMPDALAQALSSARRAYTRAMHDGPAYKDPSVTLPIPEHPIKSCRAMYELQQAMPDDASFITDIGGHTFVATSYLTVKRRNSFMLSLDLGSMGSGIGGSIGMAIADPTTPVVLIVGDGCMQMYGMEVVTAVKYQLRIIFAVMNDARYNIVHHGMKATFGDADLYDAPATDFVQWAQALGAVGSRIEKGGEVSAVVKELLRSHPAGPIVLDIAVDPDFYVSNDRVASLTNMFSGAKE